MRNKYGNQGSTLGRVLIGGSVLLTGVIFTFGILAATGRIDLPWMKRAAPPPPGQPEGTIAVPVTAEAIPAYTRLTRDHFWNAKTGSFAVVYLYPNEIGSGMFTNLNLVLGRVLAVDKKPGYAITEHELLPKGTRPGLVAGIPPGKRAIVMEASAIHGIHGLRLGDHLDLVASVPTEKKPSSGGRDARAVLDSLRPKDALGSAKKHANVIVLAEDAVLVSPVTVRHLPPPAGAKPRAGAPPQGKPVEEVVIAVEADEVTKISEALGVDAVITAVAQSGRPELSRTSIKPAAPTGPPPVTTVEVLRGGKRTTMIFAPDGSPLDEVAGSPDIVPTPPPTKRR